ncbi:MAG: tetratricopeptide repeat protein, partial [Cyanobacteria bacterium P01_D01_bin.2]
PPADACFFWQACARRRGQASNTRAGGKRTGRVLGGNDASLPYVISPRNAWIQQPGPGQPYPIRWNPVDGVSRYTVRLWQWTYERDLPDLALWETTVETADPIPFPALILDPGTYYSIEVVTDTGVSSDLDAGYFDSGFQLLFEEDYDVLRSQLAAVVPADPADMLPTGQGTSENAALARAGVFFLEEMYADALAVLEPLTDSPTASNLSYTALGDTYSNIGLNQLSIDAYDQALTLARANDDILSEAVIRVNLADVYATLGLFEDALRQLRQARSAYGQLSEETEVARLNRRIDVISSRLDRYSEDSPAP